MQLSTQEKFDAVSNQYGVQLKTLYFGDFIDDVQFEKNQAEQTYTLNHDGSLRDEEIEFFAEVYDEVFKYLVSDECTFIDMGLLFQEIQSAQADMTDEVYDFDIVCKGNQSNYYGVSYND